MKPEAPVHFLVIPKTPISMLAAAYYIFLYFVSNFLVLRKILRFWVIVCLLQISMFNFIFTFIIVRVAQKLNLESGYRIVMNNGKDGGQRCDNLLWD